MQIPTFRDVLAAQKRIKPYLKPTPLLGYPAINEFVGAEVHIKHENCQPVGAFKVRGGVNLISQLSDEIDALNGKINEFRGNVAQMKTANAKKIDFFVRNVSNEITNIKSTSSDIAKTTDKIIREM